MCQSPGPSPRSSATESTAELAAFYLHLERLKHLANIQRVLEYDASVSLPAAGQTERAAQLGYLEAEYHQTLLDPSFVRLVSELQKDALSLNEDNRINVERMFLKIQRETAISTDFAQHLAELKSQTQTLWSEAKRKSDFTIVATSLKQLVAMVREKASNLPDGDSRYERLFRRFEPYGQWSIARGQIEELHRRCLTLRQSGKLATRDYRIPALQLSEHQQEKLCHWLFNFLGFSEEFSRIDRSEHPFQSSLGPEDIRMTTRYDCNDCLQSLYAGLHEAGHALYQRALPKNWYGTPLGSAASFSVDESQSLFWENAIGRSDRFLIALREYFSSDLGIPCEAGELRSLLRTVEAGVNRIESDEVHYVSHIWMRSILEEALIEQAIEVEDLPNQWNTYTEEFFGLRPHSDREGILQDIHWFAGMFGYFPTYALGLEGAIRLHTVLPVATSGDTPLDSSECASIQTFLADAVGRHGARYQGAALIATVTGVDFSPDLAERYFLQRYGS